MTARRTLIKRDVRALSVPKSVTPRFDTIVGPTDAVCRTHLTDAYAALARELVASLARKLLRQIKGLEH